MSASAAASAGSSLTLWSQLSDGYHKNTGAVKKSVDIYLLFTLVNGLLMMFYCLTFASIPYNAFLASFLGAVGSFVLAGNRNASILISS